MAAVPVDVFRVSVVRDQGQAVVRLVGELDYAGMPQLRSALTGLMTIEQPTAVVVDAQQLDFADVAGLRPLLDLADRMRPGAVRVAGARRAVARVFQLLDRQELLT